MNLELQHAAVTLRDILVRRQQRIVLAESCTGGWVAASLACLPGISQWWCGSKVVYRCDSKHRWLGIDNGILDDPSIGPVSEQVTKLLAEQSLAMTPEASIALAVTGDLGPGVPPPKDGIVYCSLAIRGESAIQLRQTRLTQPAPQDAEDLTRRIARLQGATLWVLSQAIELLSK